MKFFFEAGIGGHYDRRYFSGELSVCRKQAILLELLAAFMQMSRQSNITPILMHGGLIGWAWNRKLLPWDQDIDLSLSLAELDLLERTRDSLAYDSTRYLFEINPHYKDRSTANHSHKDTVEENKIDARFIHQATGLYLDITALAELEPGFLNTKCPHRYKKEDIYPLQADLLNGIAVNIPSNFAAVLTQEYGNQALTKSTFGGYYFDYVRRIWRKSARLPWFMRLAAPGRISKLLNH